MLLNHGVLTQRDGCHGPRALGFIVFCLSLSRECDQNVEAFETTPKELLQEDWSAKLCLLEGSKKRGRLNASQIKLG
jgi:hypothetical protein